MRISKKLYALIVIALMCIMNVSVQGSEKISIKESGVIKESEQIIKLKKSKEPYFYAYTPNENGIKEFSFEVDGKDYNFISPAILSNDGEVLRDDGVAHAPETTKISYSLKASEKVYIGIYFDSSNDKEYNVKIKIANGKSDARIQLEGSKATTILRKDEVKGLIWNPETSTLIMNNFSSDMYNEIVFTQNSPSGKRDRIFIDIRGVNTLNIQEKNVGIRVDYECDIVFIGNGELNFVSQSENAYAAIAAYDYDVEFNGPTINIKGAYKENYIECVNLRLTAGVIYASLSPIKVEIVDNVVKYSSIYVTDDVDITGGMLYINYENPNNNEAVLVNNPAINHYGNLTAISGTIIITGYEDAVKNTKIYNDKKATIEKTLKIFSGSNIDISNFNVEVIDKKLEYDGKEKKARVKVEGLKEGRDYKVEYKNNIKVGKAEVIITGVGNFKGTLKRYFEIIPPIADGPTVGRIINDGQYKYKVTKAGSKNGVLVGSVSVVGLKKKSIKKIVIAKTVVIDGVTYNIVSIGKNAFKKNTKITSAKIGKNVVKIGTGAFSMCKNLKLVKTYSKKLKTIGYKAFFRCTKLKKVYVRSVKLKKVSKKAFAGTKYTLVVKVPKKMKKTYVKVFRGTGFTGLVK